MRARQLLMVGAALVLGTSVMTAQSFASPAGVKLHTSMAKTIKINEVNDKYQFAPKKATVKVGTKVTWKNTTDAPHTVTSDTKSWKYDKNVSADGGSVKFTFKKAGTYQ